MDNLSPPTPEEMDLVVQNSPQPDSGRLACQAVVKGDVVCVVP
jgi:ferredoxin